MEKERKRMRKREGDYGEKRERGKKGRGVRYGNSHIDIVYQHVDIVRGYTLKENGCLNCPHFLQMLVSS